MSGLSITAEGLFSVTYSSTKLGDIATGFTLNMVGEPGSLSGKTTVKVSNGETSAVWGSTNGVTLREGSSISRTHEGDSSTVMDPIYDVFQKAIIIDSNRSELAKQAKSLGNIVVIQAVDFIEILNNKLGRGKIQDFIDEVIQPPAGVTIDASRASKSPLVNALIHRKDAGTPGSRIATTIASVGSNFKNTFYTVGDIFLQYLAPLGLELYWDGDGKYYLEPPRLSQNNPKEVATIDKNDIITLNLSTDPYSAPDIVIPTMAFDSSLSGVAANSFVIESLKAGILKEGGLGGKNFKVSTYETPQYLFDVMNVAMNDMKDFAINDYTGGSMPLASKRISGAVAQYYGAHARKSTLYTKTSGECVCTLMPDIIKAYSWYKINGKMVFVSDIRHVISRSNAVTVLTIAGTLDTGLNTDDLVGYSESEIPKNEEKMRKELRKKSDAKNKEIGVISKKGSSILMIDKDKANKDDMEKIFGDHNKYAKVIKGTVIEDIVDFGPSEEGVIKYV